MVVFDVVPVKRQVSDIEAQRILKALTSPGKLSIDVWLHHLPQYHLT